MTSADRKFTISSLDRRRILTYAGVTLTVFLACRYLLLPFLHLNVTPSITTGLYWLHASSDLDRGDYATFCADMDAARFASERGYLPERKRYSVSPDCWGGIVSLTKKVVGGPGDTVRVDLDGTTINGVQVGAAPPRCDSKNRVLSPLYGRHVLRPGEYWMASDHYLGFDSEIIGPVHSSSVVGRTSLILAIGKERPITVPPASTLRVSCDDMHSPPAATVLDYEDLKRSTRDNPHLLAYPVDPIPHPIHDGPLFRLWAALFSFSGTGR
jgi:conjugative transfer signal peptidase TraF